MAREWTFGQRVAVGFAAIVTLTLVMGGVAVYALRTVVTAKDDVITVAARNIAEAERLGMDSARRVAALRGHLLSGRDDHLQEVRESREKFVGTLARLRERARQAEGQRLLDEISARETEYDRVSTRAVEMTRGGATREAILAHFDDEIGPRRKSMNDAIDAYSAFGARVLEREMREATDTASQAEMIVAVIALAILGLAATIALVLTRSLARQIGTAVSQVQSSSSELQAAATQQASGAKEQSTAMTEITTTITELLATSRQIAESAQRVAQIAHQTAGAARVGDATVEKGHEAIGTIRRQVDLIVGHMLQLGKKSQEIGSVLEIVAELAEQTNILAINATIEAAGAGEHGKRFAVVAEEIRKLADRVGGSTKEIRTLIDEVRGAVNTTVMTTETGSKAVEAGARQFAEVTSAFKQIGGLVGTTTDAAREIELSTKQQATAVEQVNVAVSNVAQASKEAAASTTQTLQTASQLSGLSRDLLRLVQPPTETREGARGA